MRNALIGLGVVAGAVALVLVGWYEATFGDLWIVNGLPVPVEVRIGGQVVQVGKETYLKAGTFRSGPRELVALLGGKEIDRRTVKLASDANVYNVLGAGPLVLDSVIYTTYQSSEPQPAGASRCGVDFDAPHATWYFQQPPSSVDMPKGSSREVRSVLRLDNGGLGQCLSQLARTPLQGADLASRAARALPDSEQLLWVAANMDVQGGEPQRALDLVGPLMAKTDALDNHRMYQYLMTRLGRRDELLGQYRARFQAHDEPTTAYLYARLLPPRQALAALPAMLAAHPESEPLHRSLAWNAHFTGDLETASAECEWYRAHAVPDDQVKDVWLEQEARVLVARGKARQALELLEAALAGAPQYSMRQALLVDRVADRARASPKVAPFKKLARQPGSTDEAYFEYYYTLLLGGRTARPPPGLGDPASTPFGALALSSEAPDRALASLKAQPDARPSYLTEEVAYLLLGEAWRRGDEVAARQLAAVDFWGGDFGALKRYVLEGGSEDELSDVRPEERTGLMLARARVLESVGKKKEAAQLVARLALVDPLQGLAVLAARRWPPVTAATAATASLRLELREDVVLEPLAP